MTTTENELTEYIFRYLCHMCAAKFPIFHTSHNGLGRWTHGEDLPCDAARVRNAVWNYKLGKIAGGTYKNQAAAELGRKGGQSTSEAKRAAVRENGKKGGRPRKQADAE